MDPVPGYLESTRPQIRHMSIPIPGQPGTVIRLIKASRLTDGPMKGVTLEGLVRNLKVVI